MQGKKRKGPRSLPRWLILCASPCFNLRLLSITPPFVSASFNSLLLIKKTGAGKVRTNPCPQHTERRVTHPCLCRGCQAGIIPISGKEQPESGRGGREQQDLRGFSGLRKLLLPGPGVQEMGSPACFSGDTPQQEGGRSGRVPSRTR